MNLLELLQEYQRIIRKSGKAYAREWLKGVVVDPVLIPHIADCFDKNGDPLETSAEGKKMKGHFVFSEV